MPATVVGMGSFIAGCGGAHAASTPPSTGSQSSDQAICVTIDGYFFYPTVPATGETVLPANAARVEAFLRTAHSHALRAEAEPLQRAIQAHEEGAMVAIFQALQSGTCSRLGVPPPT